MSSVAAIPKTRALCALSLISCGPVLMRSLKVASAPSGTGTSGSNAANERRSAGQEYGGPEGRVAAKRPHETAHTLAGLGR